MRTVIMAGGFGKRAAGIDASVPKPLLPISGKPVLLWEIECLVRQGYRDLVLTVSYMADKIADYFGDGSAFGCRITYFRENEPLGNAGALFKLWEAGELDGDFLLLNADSVFDVDFGRMAAFHRERGALATVFTHPNDHPHDSGLILASGEGAVQSWLTKEEARPRWYKNRVNAGIHIVNTGLLELADPEPSGIDGRHRADLDRDILKPLVATGRIYAYDSPEYVKDMGTPERFARVSHDLVSGKIGSRNLSKPQKAIFLDRDGTINKYAGFLRSPDQFELMDGVAEAIRRINGSGYLAIVITNQPVIARGEVTVPQMDEIHNKMETLLGEAGAYLDAIYYCPHHPDKGFDGEMETLKFDCACRKPKPGMLLKAANDFNIDLSASWMVGDSSSDVMCGKNAGCRTAMIMANRENRSGIPGTGNEPDMYVESLPGFVEFFCAKVF